MTEKKIGRKKQLYPNYMRKDFKTWLKACADDAETNTKTLMKENDKFKRLVFAEFGVLHARMMMLFLVNASMMETFNNIDSLLKKHPNRREIAIIKAELSRHRKNVVKTLQPIQSMAAEYLDRKKRMEQGNQYGAIQ